MERSLGVAPKGSPPQVRGLCILYGWLHVNVWCRVPWDRILGALIKFFL